MTFEWKCSYLDEREYRVYGDTCLRTVELYRGSPHTLTYMAGIYNGTFEEFTANVSARQNGCVVRSRDCQGKEDHQYRWTADEYQRFVDFLRANHTEEVKTRNEFIAKYPDVTFDPVEPFAAPVPMYYDMDAKTYKPEPWYAEVFS
jgi:hypothetical protein